MKKHIGNLIDVLKKPPVYTQTESQFWNDTYISKQMLKAHLDPELEAASRKMNFIDRSATWIRELYPPERAPHLLDIGCGPGIYAEKFTEAGYKVTGVDFSERSIDYARQSATQKGMDITYHYQNYLEMDLNEQFDLITMIYCDYGALSAIDREIIMNKAYQHLKPGGVFLLDVFTESSFQKREEHKNWSVCSGNGFWCEEEYVELNGRYLYENCISLNMTVIITQSEVIPYYIWDTCFSKETLAKEAERAGFMVRAFYGDVAGSPYSDESETMAVVLGK